MTHTSENEFINEDGSVDTTKAMKAGHDARTETLWEMGRAVLRLVSGWFFKSTDGNQIEST